MESPSTRPTARPVLVRTGQCAPIELRVSQRPKRPSSAIQVLAAHIAVIALALLSVGSCTAPDEGTAPGLLQPSPGSALPAIADSAARAGGPPIATTGFGGVVAPPAKEVPASDLTAVLAVGPIPAPAVSAPPAPTVAAQPAGASTGLVLPAGVSKEKQVTSAGAGEQILPKTGQPPASAEPADPPRPRPNSRGQDARSLSTDVPLSPERKFIEEIASGAQESQRVTGVPASVTLAQAILESDWGRSQLAREGKNYFGIKAQSAPGTAGVIKLPTKEVIGGRTIVVTADFRAYASVADSLTDHGRYFLENSRYGRAMQHKEHPKEFARQIHAAGYATDLTYAEKLIRLMDRFKLYDYDLYDLPAPSSAP